MNGCKITIGVPVYNGQETIKKCISSLQSQTYRNIEIIIVNDGSTDDTYNICSELAKNDNRISVVSIHNSGVSNARNCIIEKATGDYLCFVDADDFLMPYHIEGLASCIQDKNTLLATTYQIQNRGGGNRRTNI